MVSIIAKKREQHPDELRKSGVIPGVLYGPKIESSSLQVDGKTFDKIYEEAGESTLLDLDYDGNKIPVLIHDVQLDPLSNKSIHVDFYQPDLTKEVEVEVPLTFQGEAPAVIELGGTLIHNIQVVDVKALPQNLPHEIIVDVSVLKTFEDRIIVDDLVRDANFEIMQEGEDLVSQVVPVEDVEAQLEQPVEEDVEGIEKVEKPSEDEEETEEAANEAQK
jgi:large subunit ribosomal protein L25